MKTERAYHSVYNFKSSYGFTTKSPNPPVGGAGDQQLIPHIRVEILKQ